MKSKVRREESVLAAAPGLPLWRTGSKAIGPKLSQIKEISEGTGQDALRGNAASSIPMAPAGEESLTLQNIDKGPGLHDLQGPSSSVDRRASLRRVQPVTYTEPSLVAKMRRP